MRPMLSIFVAVVFAGSAVTGSAAMAQAPAVHLEPTSITMGCGHGRSRDAAGKCHHRFNRFHHHGAFHRYKQKHCTPHHTPNGMVNRCNI